MSKLEGSIERVRYYNEENGYTIASFYLNYQERKKIPAEYNHLDSNIIVVGFFDRKPIEEEEFILDGDFVIDKKYGFQFKIKNFERKQIDNKTQLIFFFMSDLFKGIGPTKAALIVNTLGEKAIEKIRNDKKVLDDLKLTNEEKDRIYQTIVDDYDNQKNFIFLLNHGITVTTAKKIINHFDSSSLIETISNNPYCLIDRIERFGFAKADNLALSLGFSLNNPYRIKALINYSLKEYLYRSGNSYIDKDELYYRTKEIINDELNLDTYNEYLNSLAGDKKIIIDSLKRIFDYYSYQEEIELALDIKERINNKKIKKYKNDQIEEAFKRVEEENAFPFSKEQKEAILKAFMAPLVIITGGPGTGKTTIVHAVIKMYIYLNNDNEKLISSIALLAPTGRAAKRLNETTNLDASTIHRYLGYDGEGHFEYSKYNKTTSRLIIVDEASMMDTDLAYHLFTSSSDNARFIIVGDVDQLPSVGPGQVLNDLINSKLIETIYLNTIHRQANDSTIINLAHNINEGYLPTDILEKQKDRNFIVTDNENLPKLTTDLAYKALQKGKTIADIQILIPQYRGNCGIDNINKLLQERINPKGEKDKEVIYGANHYRVGDKVIQLINRVEKKVMNGDIGYISSINYEGNNFKSLAVTFDTLIVEYEKDELDDLNLAYAVSIHKAQGSEFDVVILPLTFQYYAMLKRKLIYTAVTRAKSTLILIGDPNSLSHGIKNIERERQTILKEKILELDNQLSIDEKLKELDQKYQEDSSSNRDEIEINDLEDEIDINNIESEIGEKEFKI